MRRLFIMIADGHPYSDGSKCQGRVALLFCPKSEKLFCSCEECDSSWSHPKDIPEMKMSKLLEDICEGCARITPAIDDQIKRERWSQYVIGQYKEDY